MDAQGQVLKGNYGYYRTGTTIGGGRSSRVFRGEIVAEPSIPCAIKMVRDEFTSESERIQAVTRFNKEAEIVIRLNHPELVEILDYFSKDDCYYYVMELVEGRSLESLSSRPGGLMSEKEVVELGIHVCRALYYLHRQNPPLVFGSIRPRHIIRLDNARFKMVEFNLARCLHPMERKTPYEPPEFSLREGRINPLSDLFSLGVTLYELCTGEVPERELSKLKNISLELGVVIEKSTAADPSMRYRSAKEMKDALMDCLKNPDLT